jgi:hypothetical protein
MGCILYVFYTLLQTTIFCFHDCKIDRYIQDARLVNIKILLLQTFKLHSPKGLCEKVYSLLVTWDLCNVSLF